MYDAALRQILPHYVDQNQTFKLPCTHLNVARPAWQAALVGAAVAARHGAPALLRAELRQGLVLARHAQAVAAGQVLGHLHVARFAVLVAQPPALVIGAAAVPQVLARFAALVLQQTHISSSGLDLVRQF